MKNRIKIFAILLSTIGLIGCIENDIPYPIVKAFITEMSVEGGSVTIDNDKLEVNIVLDETTNINNVTLLSFVTTENSVVKPELNILPKSLDMEKDILVTLSIYQDYVWTIKATQPINREVKIQGQVGEPAFDIENHIATVYVDEDTFAVRDNLVLSSLILGASNSTMSPDDLTIITNFMEPVKFEVTTHGKMVVWTLVVSKTGAIVTNEPIDVRAKTAHLFASVGAENENSPFGFEYKKSSDSEFTQVAKDKIEYDGGTLQAIIAVESDTKYDYRVYQGELKGDIVTFTTEVAQTIPNMSFEDWYEKDKTVYPCLESEWGKPLSYRGTWKTGNEGVTSIGNESNVTGTDDAVKGKAGRLETKGDIFLVGLAAGSLFTGDFKTNMFSPEKSPRFGVPFTSRPVSLIGQYKYFPKIIDVRKPNMDKVPEDRKPLLGKIGDMDRANIWINLEDWEGATVRPKNPIVIARGEFIKQSEVSVYTDFNIILDYKINDKKPTHIVIVVASSYDGEFYIGGAGSTLYVDEFKFVY